MNDILLIRGVERILAVIIGGICVYLGYRLFAGIQNQKAGEAKLEFPGGVSVYVARIGPGVFFALFGAVIVSISLYKPIHVNDGPSPAYIGVGESTKISDTLTRDAKRNLILGEIAILNTIPSSLRHDIPDNERYKLEQAIDRTKVSLMEPVWDADWGDPIKFKRWVQNGGPEPVPDDLKKASDYFRYKGSIK